MSLRTKINAKKLRDHYKDINRLSALDVIRDYRESMDDTHNFKCLNTAEFSRVEWILDLMYRMVKNGKEPPIVIIDKLTEDMRDYSRINDIWGVCYDCCNNIIDMLV